MNQCVYLCTFNWQIYTKPAKYGYKRHIYSNTGIRWDMLNVYRPTRQSNPRRIKNYNSYLGIQFFLILGTEKLIMMTSDNNPLILY